MLSLNLSLCFLTAHDQDKLPRHHSLCWVVTQRKGWSSAKIPPGNEMSMDVQLPHLPPLILPSFLPRLGTRPLLTPCERERGKGAKGQQKCKSSTAGKIWQQAVREIVRVYVRACSRCPLERVHFTPCA